MIKFESVYKSFGKLNVLNDVSVDIDANQILALIGPNGAGKTTLIKCFLGMVLPDKGKIFFNDTLISNNSQYRQNIGYMPQIGRYPDNMKVGQLFSMLKDLRQRNVSELDQDLIKAFELEAIYHKPLKTLSGGTRQKVSAAIAFLFNPQVLILDEPTAGLDPVSADILKDKILAEKHKKLIIITSHIMSEIEELASHIMYIYNAKIQFYKPIAEIMENKEEKLGKTIVRLMKSLQ